MHPHIRSYTSADERTVIEFGLRAWAPVSESMRSVLGDEIFLLLYPDWDANQAAAIRSTVSDPKCTVWVATAAERAVGFVAADLDETGVVGGIAMLAVDPDHQRRGIGAALTRTATEWLVAQGARVVMVETGGDPGHAPARRTYERTGFTQLPIARYFQAV